MLVAGEDFCNLHTLLCRCYVWFGWNLFTLVHHGKHVVFELSNTLALPPHRQCVLVEEVLWEFVRLHAEGQDRVQKSS